MVFFSAETTEENEEKKTYHLVAKLLMPDASMKVFNQYFKSSLREYTIYTELINNFNKILSDKLPQEPLITLPKLIYGKHTSSEYILVFENLDYAGYEMNDKRKGLNPQQLKAAVDKIARIHAVSYVFYKTTDTTKYSCFPSLQEYMNTFNVLLGGMFDGCITFLKRCKDTEELGKKIELNKSSFLEKTSSALINQYQVKCLVHGDYWNNNFMFKYTDAPEGEKTIEEVKVIDWGNSSWGPPVFDLQYLLHTSTNREVRKDHLEEVLSHYHATFTMLTTQLGHPLTNWSLADLKAEWEKSYPFGFLFGCALTQGTLSTKNPANRRKLEPSILDKPLLHPVKVVVDGMKLGVAKMLIPFSFSNTGRKMFLTVMKRMMKPLLDELLSGENEAMNSRLLGLIYEADERGLFST